MSKRTVDSRTDEHRNVSQRTTARKTASRLIDIGDVVIRVNRDFKVIGVFNYKGGVAKTTSVLNLAVSMCKEGKRVLIVDADTQCSASLFFFPKEQAYHRVDMSSVTTPIQCASSEDIEEDVSSINEEIDVTDTIVVAPYPKEHLLHLEKLPKLSRASNTETGVEDPRAALIPEPNLYSVLKPVLNGRTQFNFREIAEKCPRLMEERLDDRLILLRGNSRIKEYQDQLSNATTWRYPALRNSLGAFRALIHGLATELKVDMVLVDFGPSTDTLNETFVMSCDYILPPCFPDSFSNSSIQSLLTSLLPNWAEALRRNIRGQKEYAVTHTTQDDRIDYPLHPKPPIVLSAIVSAYKTCNKRVVFADARWIRCIERTFNSAVPGLKAQGINCCYLRNADNKPCGALPLYRELASLHGACHEMLLPVTALERKDINTARQIGYNLNNSNRDGNVFDVLDDTNQKASVLSSVLLKLPVPV